MTVFDPDLDPEWSIERLIDRKVEISVEIARLEAELDTLKPKLFEAAALREFYGLPPSKTDTHVLTLRTTAGRSTITANLLILEGVTPAKIKAATVTAKSTTSARVDRIPTPKET